MDTACQAEPLKKSAVFAASGISGGSLGLVVDRALEGTGRSHDDVLDMEFLAPDVAAMAFRDLPNSLLRLETPGVDRAAVLEHAWEDVFGPNSPLADGFYASSKRADGKLRWPILLLNSATVDDGCRLEVSVLEASTAVKIGPAPPAGTENCLSLTAFQPGRGTTDRSGDASTLAASKDAYDFLCRPGDDQRHDIPVSAAAHLSARFPYVSPSGALTRCDRSGRRTYAIDGGIIEGSAVSPLTELWSRLAGRVYEINNDPARDVCIEPRLLMLDNGYLQDAPVADPTWPAELLARRQEYPRQPRFAPPEPNRPPLSHSTTPSPTWHAEDRA